MQQEGVLPGLARTQGNPRTGRAGPQITTAPTRQRAGAGSCKVTFCKKCFYEVGLRYNISRVDHLRGTPNQCCEVTTYGLKSCNPDATAVNKQCAYAVYRSGAVFPPVKRSIMIRSQYREMVTARHVTWGFIKTKHGDPTCLGELIDDSLRGPGVDQGAELTEGEMRTHNHGDDWITSGTQKTPIGELKGITKKVKIEIRCHKDGIECWEDLEVTQTLYSKGGDVCSVYRIHTPSPRLHSQSSRLGRGMEERIFPHGGRGRDVRTVILYHCPSPSCVPENGHELECGRIRTTNGGRPQNNGVIQTQIRTIGADTTG